MPEFANVHNDIFLTNLSIAYMNEEYNADNVFPVVPVTKRSGKYPIYNKDTFLSSSGVDAQGKPQSIRRPGTRSTEILWDVSNQSYYAEQIAKNMPIANALEQYADAPLNIAMDATKALTELVKLDNEIAVASKAMKRANYNTANKVQLVTTTTSWAAASGKPLSVDIPNAKKAVIKGIIKAPNRLLLDYDAAVTLSQQAEYVPRLQYNSKEALTLGGLLPVIEGLTVVEARTQKKTSAEGVTPVTTSYAWQDDQGQDAALVYYYPPSATGLYTVALGLTFDAPDDENSTHDFAVFRWFEPWIRSERIEVSTTRDYRFVTTDGSTNGDNASGYAVGGALISGVNL